MTKPQALYKELTASEITAMAISVLEVMKARVRRVHNVSVGSYKRKNHIKPGWPDIQGYDKEGKALLCEVKKIGDSLSKEQIERLTDCKNCGGIALLALQDKVTGNFKILTYPEMEIFY